MDNKVYWGRRAYLRIEDANGEFRSYGENEELDIRFSGEKVGDMCFAFECGILGLDVNRIKDLTVWNVVGAFSKPRRIEVYAGYGKGFVPRPIFAGVIVEAIPTSPPEMWLNMKCLNIGADYGYVIQQPEHMSGEYIGKIFQRICDIMKLEMSWETSLSQTARGDFVIEGPIAKLPSSFADTFGVKVVEEWGVLRCISSKPQFNKPSHTRLISTETGMLAVGNITTAGAVVRTRLDDSSGIFSWIDLRSSLVPSANGKYVIIRKKHVGHLRGNEWYTEFETIRQNAEV